MSVAIRAEGLGKAYQISHQRSSTSYRTLREDLAGLVGRLLPGRGPDSRRETVWALRNVSFEIEQGQAVGVIGRNGAGKSTLLKILSRITEPTSGHADIFGRVASLLEVGTGFHPELTGRENIYLSGTILGMTRAEVRARFDEIVEFAEIARFLDTPVKRYSSGMYVRLAFAVAAHLQPEILLVDEVLAVGDAQFQAKCLGKMKDTTTAGRTVLFVSHNMAAVRHLCPTALWIQAGGVRMYGPTPEIVDVYLQEARGGSAGGARDFVADADKDAQLRSARVLTRAGTPADRFECDDPVCLELIFEVSRALPGLYGYLEVLRADGTTVLVSDSVDNRPNPLDGLAPGVYRILVTVPPRSLAPGDYDFYLNFTSSSSFKGFNVDSPGIVGSFHLDDLTSYRGNSRHGFFSTLLSWDVEEAA